MSTAATDDSRLVFDAEFLRKLERLERLAKKKFRGLIRGEHSTPRRGAGSSSPISGAIDPVMISATSTGTYSRASTDCF